MRRTNTYVSKKPYNFDNFSGVIDLGYVEARHQQIAVQIDGPMITTMIVLLINAALSGVNGARYFCLPRMDHVDKCLVSHDVVIGVNEVNIMF